MATKYKPIHVSATEQKKQWYVSNAQEALAVWAY